MTISDFPDWLDGELNKRKMKPAELARLAKKDQGVISRILRRERVPETDTLKAIAKALKMPTVVVFRAAGILSSDPEADELSERADHIIKNYKHPETKEKALEYLEFLAIQEEKSEYRASPSSKPAKELKPK